MDSMRHSLKLRNSSHYIAMDDGVELAIDVWRPKTVISKKHPVILGFTRYWRAYDLGNAPIENQRLFGAARYFADRNIAFAMCDVRGTGASFGERSCEYSDAEIQDYKSVAAWARRQKWCNGLVIGFGVSYSGNAALLTLASSGDAIDATIPCFIDYDLYHHSTCPGGVANRWMTHNWGGLTAALDSNDFKKAATFFPDPPAVGVVEAVRGVKPVDGEEKRLPFAVAEHKSNFRASDQTIAFSDDALGRYGETLDDVSVHARLNGINAAKTPVLCIAGWFDGGTVRGATALFNQLTTDKQVVIGPWNHGMTHEVDPYKVDRTKADTALPIATNLRIASDLLERISSGEAATDGLLHYYTYGANCWRKTSEWPLSSEKRVSFFCHENGVLSLEPPGDSNGHLAHEFSTCSTTGQRNRWHTQIGSTPVEYPDRTEQDQSLLTFDTEPLSADCEVTGQPLVRLFFTTNEPDLNLFFYLEDCAPCGHIAMLAEGTFRAVHRFGALDPKQAATLGRRHSFIKSAAKPIERGAPVSVECDLSPISVVVKRNHRLRVAIAAADRDTFLVHSDDAVEANILCNMVYPSQLDLPIIPMANHVERSFS